MESVISVTQFNISLSVIDDVPLFVERLSPHISTLLCLHCPIRLFIPTSDCVLILRCALFCEGEKLVAETLNLLATAFFPAGISAFVIWYTIYNVVKALSPKKFLLMLWSARQYTTIRKGIRLPHTKEEANWFNGRLFDASSCGPTAIYP